MTGAILGFIPPVGGAVGFLEARTSKLGKDLEKKMDRNKIDLENKMEKIMEMLIALGKDVAFIKGADSKKK